MTETNTTSTKKLKVLDLIYIAIFAVLISICAWVTIPGIVPFTLQTLGIFCTVGLLGGRRGTITLVIYLLLGIIGLPVFAGFRSGLGVLLGTTGGYIIGFVCIALVYWLITSLLGEKTWCKILGMVLGLIVCYAFGTVWYMVAYASQTGSTGLLAVLGLCVFPFILPDLAKLCLAMIIIKSLQKHIHIQ